MNTIKKNCLTALVALSALPVSSILFSAHAQKTTLQQLWANQNPQATNAKPISTRDFSTKAAADTAAAARQKLGYKTTVTYDAKRKVYVLSEYAATTTTTTKAPVFNPTAPYPSTSKPPTSPPVVADNPVLSRREFSTKASAEAAAAARNKLGFYTTVVYDDKNKVYILREYAKAPAATVTTPVANPVLSRREFDTKASADAAAAARTKLGFYTTVVYDDKNKVYILREYAKAPAAAANPVLSQRDFSTKASADAAAAARQQLGFKTTVTYDAKRKVYVLSEYAADTTPDTNPVLSRREFSTKASADAAAAARTKLGFYTTVVYDDKNKVYILREYAKAPAVTATTPAANPVLSERRFSTQASADAAAAARQKLGFKTTVVYDAQNRVYILREYKGS